MDFQIGDRVRAVRSDYPGLKVGEYGIVVGYDGWDDPVVEWDDCNPHRHDADGMTREGRGWFVDTRYIELAKADDLGELPTIDPEVSSKFLFDI